MNKELPEGQTPGSGSIETVSGEYSSLPHALRTFAWGVLHAIGMFDFTDLTNAEKEQDKAEYRTWFCLGETCMATLLAVNIAVPAGIWFAGMTALPLAFIGAGTVFLPAFVFLPKLIRYAMKADTDKVLEAFGKNEHMKKVFWALFMATAGLVLAQVVDPATAQEIAEVLARIVP